MCVCVGHFGVQKWLVSPLNSRNNNNKKKGHTLNKRETLRRFGVKKNCRGFGQKRGDLIGG